MELNRTEKLVIATALQQLAMTHERMSNQATEQEYRDEYFELSVETHEILDKFMKELGLRG